MLLIYGTIRLSFDAQALGHGVELRPSRHLHPYLLDGLSDLPTSRSGCGDHSSTRRLFVKSDVVETDQGKRACRTLHAGGLRGVDSVGNDQT